MLVTKQVAGQYLRERRFKMTDSKSHPEPVVYLVDDNPQTSLVVAELIKTFGHQVRLFDSAEMFLENVDENRPGCVVLDIRLSSLGDSDVQQKLKQRGIKQGRSRTTQVIGGWSVSLSSASMSF